MTGPRIPKYKLVSHFEANIDRYEHPLVVSVWEPIERKAPPAKKGGKVVTCSLDGYISIDWYYPNPYVRRENWPRGTTHYQLFPEPPDATRDAELAAAVKRAKAARPSSHEL